MQRISFSVFKEKIEGDEARVDFVIELVLITFAFGTLLSQLLVNILLHWGGGLVNLLLFSIVFSIFFFICLSPGMLLTGFILRFLVLLLNRLNWRSAGKEWAVLIVGECSIIAVGLYALHLNGKGFTEDALEACFYLFPYILSFLIWEYYRDMWNVREVRKLSAPNILDDLS